MRKGAVLKALYTTDALSTTDPSEHGRCNDRSRLYGMYSGAHKVQSTEFLNNESAFVQNYGTRYCSSYGNSQVGKGAVERFKVR